MASVYTHLYKLTPKELEVEQLVSDGFTSRQIAVKLSVSLARIQNLRTIIKQKRLIDGSR